MNGELVKILDNGGLRARNEIVIIRVLIKETVKGMVMPQNTAEGAEYAVVGMGDQVKDLKIGDKVRMFGTENVDWAFVPNTDKKLLSIPQKNIPFVEGTVFGENCSNSMLAPLTEVEDNIPEFNPNDYPDADLGSKAPENLALAAEVMAQVLPDDQDVIHFTINGDRMAVIVDMGDDEKTILEKTQRQCKLKYGNGKLVKLNADKTFHWRTR